MTLIVILTVLLTLIVLLIVIVLLLQSKPVSNQNICTASQTAEQTAEQTGNENTKLLPIMDPAFNLRESAKQMILLEDHLSCAAKLCQDCVKKHLLMIEGLLEEALSLDMNGSYKQIVEQTLAKLRDAEKAWVNGQDPCIVSHTIRKIRKPLHTQFFNVGL